MKKAITIVIILMATSISRAATKTETVDGITWSFETKWDGQNYVEIYKWNSGYYPVISTSTTGSITVPDWLGGAIVRHIGQSAFLGCSGITSITIPDRVTIDDRAFSGCSGLADKDGFVIIRDVLYDYVGNQPDIVVPGNVRIGGYAFNACDILENVVIPDGIKDIGVSSFSESKRLAQLSIPNSVTNIGQTAFSGCSALTCVTIPQCVCLKTISAIFPSYQSITNIIIADGVSTIGAECFSGCESLQSITLPQSVTSIREKAFKDCISLKTVRFLGNAPDAEENIFQGTPRTLTVQVEGGSIGWSGGVSTVLPSSWCDRAIAYADGSGSGGTGQVDPFQPVVTNFVYTTVTNEVHHYSTVTNCIYSTVTNEVFHYSTVTNEVHHHTTDEIHHYSTVTNEVFHYMTVTNELFHYSTVTNEIQNYMTVTNELHHYETVTNEVQNHSTVTNVMHVYSTVTNVVEYVPEPGTSPDAGYTIRVGEEVELTIVGAAGWDAFGVPDGMTWNRMTGKLSGRASRSGIYDLLLLSGSGVDTRIMRTTITVTGGAGEEEDGDPLLEPIKIVGGDLVNGTMTFSVDLGSLPDFGNGLVVIKQALPTNVQFKVTGGKKLDAGKAALLKYQKVKVNGVDRYVLTGLDDTSRPNVSGVKLTYAPKTGILKGFFVVYASDAANLAPGVKPKLKKYKVAITGAVVNGVGIGQATMAKPAAGPWAIELR